VEDYGIFVELAPNLAGLAECASGPRAGDSAAVYIKRHKSRKDENKAYYRGLFYR
ncbi:hypothetical protein LEA_06396, partial [human gut metagenome]